jgi:DNA-binding MarR family transcriptional regulator
MSGRLRIEIKQRRSFSKPQEEVLLSMLRTADQIALPLTGVLRTARLSFSQYNVLRILRGAGKEGLPCGEISERMIRRDPDLTRLLDRLESRGLVDRSRGTTDRRVVRATITTEGLKLLQSLDDPIESTLDKTLSHMTRKRLNLLCELLEEARGVSKSSE